jgi:hypothetical protein|tara:strand:+ start:3875 stop:4624 length:750 start_codon:yes stop_codon:yes gene_type:complete
MVNLKTRERAAMNELLEQMNKEVIGTGKWEFASAEWCQHCGELGANLLRESDLDLNKYSWGFSEEYTLTPERLMAGRKAAGYYFMISDGEASGGAGLPEDCLALPGFHIKANWASIASQSSYFYDGEGNRGRGADEAKMWAEIAKLRGDGAEPLKAFKGKKVEDKNAPRCHVCGSTDHVRENCPVWPPGVGEALSVDTAEGKGLHNLTARALKHSPELLALPQSSWGVPDVAKMNDAQKSDFMKLLGIE